MGVGRENPGLLGAGLREALGQGWLCLTIVLLRLLRIEHGAGGRPRSFRADCACQLNCYRREDEGVIIISINQGYKWLRTIHPFVEYPSGHRVPVLRTNLEITRTREYYVSSSS